MIVKRYINKTQEYDIMKNSKIIRESHKFEENHKKITSVIEKIITNNEVEFNEFLDVIPQSNYVEEFIDNLTSREIVVKNCNLVAKAFENRNNEKLINRINQSKRKNRIRSIVAIASSVASAVMFISFLLIKPNEEVEKIAIANSGNEEISVPTLIIGNSDIVKLDNTNNKLIAVESVPDSIKVNLNKNVEQKIIIPRGHTYTVVLSDNTEVILNANSELRYATNFNESEREVFLKGEAYFKVMKSKKAFIVNSQDIAIQVYGTEFNVKTIDSTKVETILVSGSIGATVPDREEIMIEPNQLLSYNKNESSVSVKNVNVSNYLQWIDGNFNYNMYSLKSVIKDLEAWYNIEVTTDKSIDDMNITFFTSKESNIKEVLHIIEITSGVKFIKEEGNKYSIHK